MSRNYKTATNLGLTHDDLYRWGESRNTDTAVALAIHAIASHDRTPEVIWEDPTNAESQHVEMAVQDYVIHGDYPAGEYRWGEYRFDVSDELN
jgi:hypothetical protein